MQWTYLVTRLDHKGDCKWTSTPDFLSNVVLHVNLVWVIYFLLRSSDCMLETSILLSGVKVF